MTGKSAFADKIVCALIRDEDTCDSSKLLQLYLVHSIERWEASNVYNDLRRHVCNSESRITRELF